MQRFDQLAAGCHSRPTHHSDCHQPNALRQAGQRHSESVQDRLTASTEPISNSRQNNRLP